MGGVGVRAGAGVEDGRGRGEVVGAGEEGVEARALDREPERGRAEEPVQVRTEAGPSRRSSQSR